MTKYDPAKIEPKWQEYWEAKGSFKALDFDKRKKLYVLDMFPYVSGKGIHVGHPLGYTATDIYSRYMRMKGYNVLHPMGFDAFGLPTENFAIKNKINPADAVAKFKDRMREQIKRFGFSYDWDREVTTSEPEYYKWTQWIFLKLLKRGLAYEDVVPINWCPSCKTGLANEEVIGGKCERCSTNVERKDLKQWMLRITDYADRLLKDVDLLDWPEKIKEMQRNWIGKSEGASIEFRIQKSHVKISVYTTRIDTLYGATFLVLAPEHPKVGDLTAKENEKEVKDYIKKAKQKTDLERGELEKDKTGVFTGSYALNPVNGAKIPIWVADYVMMNYGSGAIMAVPAHDDRDFDFAKKYGIPIIEVISSDGKGHGELEKAYVGEGKMINSSKKYDGLNSHEAMKKIFEDLFKKGIVKKAVNYKLRDWIFSRQRYWGEPIPVVHCESCGVVPVPEKDLPVTLPEIKNYEPTGTGESPLAGVADWVNTECPECGGKAKREANTMPQWAGSCWYYLRYIDPNNDKEAFSKKKMQYWCPVDFYVGGAEHAVLHLLYARFWHKVLFDEGCVDHTEPFIKLVNQGLIQGKGGVKMSKSRGNVVDPDEIIEKHGADAFRMYYMFMGPLEDSKPWDPKGIVGVKRFIEKVWNLQEKVKDSKASLSKEFKGILNRTIKKVGEDIEKFRFNTAISSLMILANGFEKLKDIPNSDFENFLKILSPFAPHVCEEIWQSFGYKESIMKEKWPVFDANSIQEEMFELVVQVNGKFRDKIIVENGIGKEKVLKLALASEKVKKHVGDKKVLKEIFVPDRLINFVVK